MLNILRLLICCLSLAISQSQAAWIEPPTEISLGSGTGPNVILSGAPKVAAGTGNNAVAVWVEEIDDCRVYASSYGIGGWTSAVWLSEDSIFTDTDYSYFPEVAMDSTNTAVAVWADYDEINIQTSVFDGTNWSPIVFHIDNRGTNEFPDVAMDGNGNAVIAWTNDFGPGPINTSFYDSGTQIWTAIQSVPQFAGTTAANHPAVAYSADGTASVLSEARSGTFPNYTYSIEASIHNGASWGAAQILSSGSENSAPDVGMDSSGNAIAVWQDDTLGLINSSIWNGTSWSSSTVISTGSSNTNARISVAPNGRAVVVWTDGNNILANQYDGSSWGTPTSISSGNFNIDPQVSVDANGNAVAVWSQQLASDDNYIWSACLIVGEDWEGPTLVQNATEVYSPDVAVSTDFIAYADWVIEPNGVEVNASVNPNPCAPEPPSGLEGSVCEDKFATQFDRVHELTWAPAIDGSVISYNIRRNEVLIGNVLATDPLIFRDHNRNKNISDLYSVTSLTSAGFESEPITIILK